MKRLDLSVTVNHKLEKVVEDGKTKTIRVKAEPREVAFTVNIGETITEEIERIGADIVYSVYRKGFDVLARNPVRNRTESGQSIETIQAFMDGWRPEQQREVNQQSAEEKAMLAMFKSLSPEKRAALLANMG